MCSLSPYLHIRVRNYPQKKDQKKIPTAIVGIVESCVGGERVLEQGLDRPCCYTFPPIVFVYLYGFLSWCSVDRIVSMETILSILLKDIEIVILHIFGRWDFPMILSIEIRHIRKVVTDFHFLSGGIKAHKECDCVH